MTSAGIVTRDSAAAAAMNERAGKYLIFELGREEFGIRVVKVREIRRVQDITEVPGTPAYVSGVINLRGKVIPVVDLRLKFSLPEIERTQRTCIVVVQAQASSHGMLMGSSWMLSPRFSIWRPRTSRTRPTRQELDGLQSAMQ